MKRRKKQPPSTFACPNCGAEVVVGRKACRECGSDDLTGWQSSDEIDYQSIDIPDGYGPDDESTQLPPPSRPVWIVIVALIAAAALLLWALRG
jgi:hypothetical protein